MWPRPNTELKKDNYLGDLNPICKLEMVGLYITGCFLMLSFSLTALMLWLILPVTAAIASKVQRRFYKAMLPIIVLVIMILCVQATLIPGPDLWCKIFFIPIYQSGVRSGLILSFMILNISSAFIWLFKTTTNAQLAIAIENLGLGAKAGFVFQNSLKMIDIFRKNLHKILNAQQARGVETEGSLSIRLKALLPSLIPLIVASITEAEERALTLEAKGLTLNGKKTHLLCLNNSGNEVKTIWICRLIILILILGRLGVWLL